MRRRSRQASIRGREEAHERHGEEEPGQPGGSGQEEEAAEEKDCEEESKAWRHLPLNVRCRHEQEDLEKYKKQSLRLTVHVLYYFGESSSQYTSESKSGWINAGARARDQARGEVVATG